MLTRASRLVARTLSYKTGPVPVAAPSQSDIKKAMDSPALSDYILSQPEIPSIFVIPTALSLMPLIAASACTAICPHLGALLPVLPNVANTAIVYSSLVGSMYCGVHWGLAAAYYSPEATGAVAARNRLQFFLSALGPCCLWAAVASMTLFP